MTKNAIFTKTTSGLFYTGPAPADPTLSNPCCVLAGHHDPHLAESFAKENSHPHLHVKVLSSLQCALPSWHRHTHKPFLRFEIQPKATPLLQVIRGIFRKVHTSFWLCHAPTLKYQVVCSLPARSHFPLPRSLTRCSHPGFALIPLRLLPLPGHVLSSLGT